MENFNNIVNNTVEFIGYDGDYPCLCYGTLTLCINGENVQMENCLASGGAVWFDDDWTEHVECGAWDVDVPAHLAHLAEKIKGVVNANVPYGCCGGCV